MICKLEAQPGRPRAKPRAQAWRQKPPEGARPTWEEDEEEEEEEEKDCFAQLQEVSTQSVDCRHTGEEEER